MREGVVASHEMHQELHPATFDEMIPQSKGLEVWTDSYINVERNRYTGAHLYEQRQKLNLQGGWTYIHAFHSSN